MAKRSDIVIGIIMLISLVIFVFIVFSAIIGFSSSDSFELSGRKIGVVEIVGLIYDSRSAVRQLNKYQNDNSIEAIIVYLNSPGGAIVPSNEIYEKVKEIRDSGKKPVIASMSSLGASGAYYIACGADSIIANQGTFTGSIGVIMELMNTRDLFEKVGVSFEAMKSGKFKDSGSPHRDMNSEDRRYLQSLIDDSYDQFVDVVVKERDLEKEEVLKIADGRVFTGRQAYNLKLIDKLGTFEDAIDVAKEMAGISGKARIVKERRRKLTLLDLIFGDLEENLYRLQGAPKLEYRMN